MLQRVETGEFQALGFRESVHDVECLHGLSGRAFHQIVDGADHDETIRFLVSLKPDVAVISPGQKLGFRRG